MKWQDAEARLAAKNATIMRAALRRSIDPAAVWSAWMETHPQKSDNITLDRAKARAWAMLHMQVDEEPVLAALRKLYAEAWVLGEQAADQMMREVSSSKAAKAGPAMQGGAVDWDTWKPGDEVAAALLRKPKGLKRLLDEAGVVSRSIKRTGYERVGTALADAIAAGMSDRGAARLLLQHMSDPARALTIAVTEQNRAVSAATVQRYTDAGLERMEWHVSDPCPTCAIDAGQTVRIGEPFPSGHMQPPAHPHCRCVLLPVFEEEPASPTAGVIAPPPPSVPVAPPAKRKTGMGFVEGEWKELDYEARKAHLIKTSYSYMSPEYAERLLANNAADQALLKGRIFINGEVEARFYGDGAKVTEEVVQEMLQHLGELQLANGGKQTVFEVGAKKANAYGWAELGGRNIWLHPDTALKGLKPNLGEGGSYKMPALRTTAQWRYTMTHEFGHHIDQVEMVNMRMVQARTRVDAVERLIREHKDAFLSGYGRTNTMESVAEMFAEWFLTGGKTDNTLVQAAAKEFGWKA